MTDEAKVLMLMDKINILKKGNKCRLTPEFRKIFKWTSEVELSKIT